MTSLPASSRNWATLTRHLSPISIGSSYRSMHPKDKKKWAKAASGKAKDTMMEQMCLAAKSLIRTGIGRQGSSRLLRCPIRDSIVSVTQSMRESKKSRRYTNYDGWA